MTSIVPTIPDISSVSDISPSMRQMLAAMATTLKLYTGRLPNASQDDRVVTFRDLAGAAGAKAINSNPAVSTGGTNTTTIIQAPGSGDDTTDRTEPPGLNNVVVAAAQTGLIVSFDQPTYNKSGTSTSNHARTDLYLADAKTDGTSPGFAAAKVTAQTSGPVMYVPVGNGRNLYVWLRNVSRADVEGPLYGGAAGVHITTPDSIDALLDLLAGQLSQDELVSSLSSKIDLITAPAATPGSVNARILMESETRQVKDDALASRSTALEAAIANSTTGLAAAHSRITAEATARAAADSANAETINTVQASLVGGANLLPNAGFDVDIAGWKLWYKQVSADPDPYVARDCAGDPWHPSGIHVLGIHRPGTPTGYQEVYLDIAMPVEPGGRYCVSGWLAQHRCSSQIFVRWFDVDDNPVGDLSTAVVTQAMASGGQSLSGFYRAFVFGAAPSAARTVRIYVKQHVTGEVDPYTWLGRPMLERATAAQTQPSPWSPSAAGLTSAVAEVKATATATAATVSSAYSIKVQALANGSTVMAGIGLLADSGTGSEVAILANRFKIVGTSGLESVPFTVYTSSSVESGVTIPAGVYMDAARIRNVDALIARIGSAAIDQAKIGQLDVSKINAGSMTASFAQAVTGQFQYLSSIKSSTGYLLANRVEVTQDEDGTGWGYIRSYSKWWGDGVNGWVMARGVNGDTFMEFRALSSRLWMSSWGDCGISFPNFSVDNNGNAIFSGTVSYAHGTLGTITAGYLQNANNTASINLNATGDQVFARWGGVDRVWANGRTRFVSDVISANWQGLNLEVVSYDEASGTSSYGVGSFVIIDTGITMDSLPWQMGYEDDYYATVSGYSINGNLSYFLSTSAPNTKLVISAERLWRMPTAGEDNWGNVTMKFIVKAYLHPIPSPMPSGTGSCVINSVVLNIKRGA